MIHSNSRSCAIRAVARLAMVRPHVSIFPEELCADTDLPKDSVDELLRGLVRRGLLTNSNSPGGGFALARNASEISIQDIMQALSGVKEASDVLKV